MVSVLYHDIANLPTAYLPDRLLDWKKVYSWVVNTDLYFTLSNSVIILLISGIIAKPQGVVNILSGDFYSNRKLPGHGKHRDQRHW